MYAIVDIETTGSYASGHRITEIAICILEEGKIIETFESLVNPCRPIPYFIQTLTGISDEMVADAPLFEEIAPVIYNLLRTKVFVAHNVNFDYSFIRSMLADHGYDLNCKKLCTVRLSRSLIPELKSYKLRSLCDYAGIINGAPHRALGDTLATTELFNFLLKLDVKNTIARSISENTAFRFPPHVPFEQFAALPTGPGVYYFHDKQGKIVYVGKAKNIKSRVNGHFSSGLKEKQKQAFISRIHSLSYERCGTELMASILEDNEIKRLWPEFNRAQKRQQERFGLFSFEDQNGYLRLILEKIKPNFQGIRSFYSLAEGYSFLLKLVGEYHLCPKLCFIQRNPGPCKAHEEGNCSGACEKAENPSSYNSRVEEALAGFSIERSFAIIDSGVQTDERSCILVVKGKLIGMGYLPVESTSFENAGLKSAEHIKTFLKPVIETSLSKQLIRRFTEEIPSRVTYF